MCVKEKIKEGKEGEREELSPHSCSTLARAGRNLMSPKFC